MKAEILKIDKAQVLNKIITQVENEVTKLREGFEEARLTSIEAPGRMQSRYDTMGVEAAWMADGLSRNLSEKIEALRHLKNLVLPHEPEYACIGCIVGVGSEGGDVKNLYFILPPSCGGVMIELPEYNSKVLSVSLQAPIANGLLGKTIDDEVTLSGKTEPAIILSLI